MHPEPFDPQRRGSLESYPVTDVAPLPDADETLDVSKYIGALRRRWLLLVVCVLIAVSYALVRYSLTTKEYISTTTIQIERKRLSLYALGQGAWLEDWWNMEYYPTQYRLLRSRGMAERVVQNLRLYENPVFTGRPSAPEEGEVAGISSSIELANLAARIQGGLEVRPIKETQLVELSFRSTSPELAAQIADGYAQAFIEWGIETRNTTVDLASTFLAEQIETVNAEIEERQKLLNSLASEGDFALDPEGEGLLERQQSLRESYNDTLANRIRLEAEYRGIQSMAKETVVDAESGGQVSQLKSELFLLESEYKTKLGTFTETWPEMQESKKEIDEKKAQLEALIEETYSEVRNRAFADFQTAKREEQSLEEALNRITADARLQNSAALEYTNHKTFIETRKELRDDLFKRQSETEIASRTQTSQESNVRVVDTAIIPGSPFRPSLRNDLSRAIFLGLFLGLGGIFVLEFMDRTIKIPEELEGVLGLPTLAVVPDIEESRGGLLKRYVKGSAYGYSYGYGYGGSRFGRPGSKEPRAARKRRGAKDDERPEIELLPDKNPRLAVCEAYRSLRTALLLSSANRLQVVAVTSAQPAEGKTVTTCNLGVVFAQLGRRVLVLDADLRRPRMHKVFKKSNRLGVVNYLTGNVAIDDLLIDTGVPQNDTSGGRLYVCPSGPIPPNPSELLASDRMREFIDQLRERFDFILIDTPPTIPVTDTVILGPLADGLVVCARAGYLQRDDAKLCRERLRYGDLKILGAVLNRYTTGAGSYNRRYQYYGSYGDTAPTEAHSAA